MLDCLAGTPHLVDTLPLGMERVNTPTALQPTASPHPKGTPGSTHHPLHQGILAGTVSLRQATTRHPQHSLCMFNKLRSLDQVLIAAQSF